MEKIRQAINEALFEAAKELAFFASDVGILRSGWDPGARHYAESTYFHKHKKSWLVDMEETGLMMSSIDARAVPNGAILFTRALYAAAHEFGSPMQNLPQRQILTNSILEHVPVVVRHIEAKLHGLGTDVVFGS